MMRIALDARKLRSTHSGIGIYTLNVMRALLEEDKDLEILLICNATGGRGRLADSRVVEVGFPFPPISPYTRYALGAFLRRQRFDVLHTPFDVVPRGLHRPLVVTIHDLNWLVNPRYNALPPLLGWAARAYYRANLTAAMQEAQRLLAVSQATRQAICAYAPWHDAKVHVTYNGLDTSRIYPMDQALAARQLAPYLPPGTPFVLTVGQGAPYKNHLHAVQGFLAAFRDHPSYRLILVRRAVQRETALHTLLRQPHVQGRVLVWSYVTDGLLNALYNAARIVLHPSYYEGFGLPLVEAMAVGTPLITSSVSAMPEIVGPAALLVDPADVRAIGAALQTLDRDEVLRARLSAAGRQRVQRFSWRACARATLAAYREVA
jgi:glycosyltransferase involved in cell wall biosynthesis